MAKKDTTNPGVLFENPDMELIHRQLSRMETTLNEKINEVNNRIVSIPPPQSFPALAVEPPSPQPIEVKLPPGLAKSSDIASMTAMMKSMNETLAATLHGISGLRKSIEVNVKVNYQEIIERSSVKAAEASAKKVIDTLSPKIEKSTANALATGALKSPGISLDDASAINARLGRIEDSIELRDRTEWHKKRFAKLLILHLVTVVLLCLSLWWAFDIKEERDELLKVEWLYRLERAITSDAEFSDLIEKGILSRDDKERDQWKTMIVNKEQTAPEFRYFHPHDDWQPNPKKEKRPQPLKEVTTEKKVKETDPSKMDSYELLEENMRRAKNGEHIIDPKTRR